MSKLLKPFWFIQLSFLEYWILDFGFILFFFFFCNYYFCKFVGFQVCFDMTEICKMDFVIKLLLSQQPIFSPWLSCREKSATLFVVAVKAASTKRSDR